MGQMWELKQVNYARHLTVPGLGSLLGEYWRAEHIPEGACNEDVSASSRNLGPPPSLVQISGAGQEGNDPCRHDPARMEDKQGEDLPLSPGCTRPYVDTELV